MFIGNKNSLWAKTNKGHTFIGGIGATTNTPQLLADLLQIDVSWINNFIITNNDIDCYIFGEYEMPEYCFDTNNEITSYWDYDGKVTAINTRCFEHSSGSYITHLYFPKCVAINGGYNIRWSRVLEVVYIPDVVLLGISTGNDNVMTDCNSGFRAYLNPFIETCNSGLPDGDISNSFFNGAANYVTNYTSPEPIDDLVAANVYYLNIEISWSIPSSTNAIDYYEVYVDGVLYDTTEDTEILIEGLTNLQTYEFTVQAIDVFYNHSALSNVLTETIDGDYIPNADLFISNANITDPIQQQALITLEDELRFVGVFTKLKAIYPIIGGIEYSHQFNLADPRDLDEAFRITFNIGITHDNLGMLPTSSSGYGDTHLIGQNNLTLNSHSIGVYINTLDTSTDFSTVIGCNNSGTHGLYIAPNYLTNGAISRNISYTESNFLAHTSGVGFYISTTLNGICKFSLNDDTPTTQTQGKTKNDVTVSIAFPGFNRDGILGEAPLDRICFGFIGDNLTDADVTNINAIVQAFQTTLNRGI